MPEEHLSVKLAVPACRGKEYSQWESEARSHFTMSNLTVICQARFLWRVETGFIDSQDVLRKDNAALEFCSARILARREVEKGTVFPEITPVLCGSSLDLRYIGTKAASFAMWAVERTGLWRWRVVVRYCQRQSRATGLEHILVGSGQWPRYGRSAHPMKGREVGSCLLYTSPSPRDRTRSRMPSSA